MSKKGYTKVEREQVGRDLLTVGLEMLSQRGLKGTTLQDILQAVGISKPFFYGNYYTSLVAHDMASGALAPKKPQYGDPDYYSFKPGESL